jgi:hypothetical protein
VRLAELRSPRTRAVAGTPLLNSPRPAPQESARRGVSFPAAEFVATADGSNLASVIKPNGKKTISGLSDLPALYRSIPTASYTQATGLSGIGRITRRC